LIEPGDEAVGGAKHARHASCARGSTTFVPDRDDDDETLPVEDTSHIPASGLRNHARLCGGCNMIHAGECW
jgi:hypothetical protein